MMIYSLFTGNTTLVEILGHDGAEGSAAIAAISAGADTVVGNRSEVIFTSTGASFAPVLAVAPGAVVQWRFADGTISNFIAPQKTYGRKAIRKNYLRVTPWSALTRVNIGYDGSDGGSDTIEQVAPQGVIKVENMALMAPYLRQWCSSYNDIPSLVFDNFTNLDTIECYYAIGLTAVSLHNTPVLRRACFEACRLKELDVSESPNLEDLRSAVNQNTGIHFGPVGKGLWHLCVRDNPQFTQPLPLRQFGAMRELLIWNTHQSGPLFNVSHALTNVVIGDNRYTSADFSDNPNLVTCDCQNNVLASLRLKQCPALVTLNCSRNRLTTLDISSCPALLHIDAHHNLLTLAAVDGILAALVNAGHTGGMCNLALNSPPSSAGLESRAILISRGWSVTVATIYADNLWRLHEFASRILQVSGL